MHEAYALLCTEIWGTFGQMSHIKEEEVKLHFCIFGTIEKLIVVYTLVKAFVTGTTCISNEK